MIKYNEILNRAKQSYDTKLWNGKYYKYDCSNSNYNDSIMTDMCCGHWYLRSAGFKHEVICFSKIYIWFSFENLQFKNKRIDKNTLDKLLLC